MLGRYMLCSRAIATPWLEEVISSGAGQWVDILKHIFQVNLFCFNAINVYQIILIFT